MRIRTLSIFIKCSSVKNSTLVKMASLKGDWSLKEKDGLEDEDASEDTSDAEWVEDASPPSSEWSIARGADAARVKMTNIDIGLTQKH